MSITIEKNTYKKYCYIGLDSKKFDDILQSIGVNPIGKNLWVIDADTFTFYDVSIPYNIGLINYQDIYNEVLSGWYEYIEFRKED